MKFNKMFGSVAASLVLAVSTAHAGDMIASGDDYTLYIDNGQLMSIGANHSGQAGMPSDTKVSINAVMISTPALVSKVAAKKQRSLILLDDGTVHVAGMSISDSTTEVVGFNTATDVAASAMTAFVLQGGEVYAGWSTNANEWTKIDGMEDIVSITAGYYAVFGITSTGDVYVYGYNVNGSLGLGHTNHVLTIAEQVQGIPAIQDIGAGKQHTIFLDTAGSLWATGADTYGGLGLGQIGDQTVPQYVSGISDVVDVTAGGSVTMVALADGSVYGTGWHNYINEAGTVRNFTYDFIAIEELSDILGVVSGMDNHFAYNGSDIVAWGGNTYSKSGLGTVSETHAPVNVFAYTQQMEEIILPEIIDVQPGGSYIITGSTFGDTTGTVSMDGFEFDIKSWTNTEVHIENPPVTMTGYLVITDVEGLVSNAWMVTLEANAPTDTPVIEEEQDSKGNNGHHYGQNKRANGDKYSSRTGEKKLCRKCK